MKDNFDDIDEKKTSNVRDLLKTHLAVMLFGASGVLARSMTATALSVTFGRVLISSISLFTLLKIKRVHLNIHDKRTLLFMLFGGAMMAIHWCSFLGSVKIASVAIGTITFATFPVFITFLEPLLFHEKLRRIHIVEAAITIIGVLVMIPLNDLTGDVAFGVLLGMFSSASYAVLSLINRKLTVNHHSVVISFYEQTMATVMVAPVVAFVGLTFVTGDLWRILVLGVVCTAFSHTLFISALGKIKVQTASIITGMEPVYGIVLAIILLHEPPGVREIIGGVIVFSVTLYSTLSAARNGVVNNVS
ncbi:MAG: DMT family transporter [Clostridiales Family XIII bacterium]|jgi:drug/metabolite transporter (DMT)-like permease|nr:DMT family transporter [Clostridiales Family XIII bacterium]